MVPPEISQVCGTSALGSPLADENGQPTPSVVHPLARPWQIHGPDDGSRMTRESHVRFCEGLWVKLPRSTLQPFRNSTTKNAPQAAILFDKFHIIRHLGEALDKVRKSEYARLEGKKRRFIKGQKYTLLSHPQNLTGSARKNLRLLLAANKRLNTAYLLKESLANCGITTARPGHGSSSRTGAPS